MPFAIFGITNDGLNLAASLILLALIALYIALVVYTFLDSRRRIDDPFLVACATVGSLIPFIGTAVYTILRPPEYLEDARERELEIKAAELRVRQLAEMSCPNCNFPVEKNYLRCPNCQRRLKDPCHHCGKPVDPRWALCPYCESSLPGRQRQGHQEQDERRGGDEPRRAAPRPRSESRQGGQPSRGGERGTAERQTQSSRPAPRRSRPQPSDGASDGGDSDARPSGERPQRNRPDSGGSGEGDEGRGGSASD